MKILQINVSGSGSTGHIANAIHTRLLKGGDESLFLYARGTDALQTKAGLYKNALLTRLTGMAGAVCIKDTDAWIAAIERFSPDSVHLHNLHGYYVHIFRLLSYLKERRYPTVITLHDEFLYTGKCAFSGNCDRYLSGCGDCPQKNAYPKVFLDQSAKLFRMKQTIFAEYENLHLVAPSQWLADRAKAGLLKEHSVCVIPNGVETDVFCPGTGHARKKYGIAEQHIVFAAAQGLMSPRKGGKYVLELAEAMPDVRFLLADSNKRQVPANVTLLSHIRTRAEMADLYRSADAFVITSREDNFPTVCLEAAACGTPVAGFDCGGIPETVSPDISSFVPYRDVASLKAAVTSLFPLQDKTKNASSAKTAEDMYKAYRNLYKAAKTEGK